MRWRIETLYERDQERLPIIHTRPVAPLCHLNLESACYNDPSVYTNIYAYESVSNRWSDLARCRIESTTNYHFLIPLSFSLHSPAMKEQ